MLFALLHTQPNASLPTFHHQSSLPKLPVPQLRQTLDKYLHSLEPFYWLSQQAGGEGVEKQRERRAGWARAFETGVGERCQQRLQSV